MNDIKIYKNIIDLAGGFIINANTPTKESELVNKRYVDNLIVQGSSGVSYLVFNNYTAQTYTHLSSLDSQVSINTSNIYTLSSETWYAINNISGGGITRQQADLIYLNTGQTSNFLSANTSFYTQAQANTNFLSANTSLFTRTQADLIYLNTGTSFSSYTLTSTTYTLSSETWYAINNINLSGYYTSAQTDANFLSANTVLSATLTGLTDVSASTTNSTLIIYTGSTNKWINISTQDLTLIQVDAGTIYYTANQCDSLFATTANTFTQTQTNSYFVLTASTSNQTILGTKKFNSSAVSFGTTTDYIYFENDGTYVAIGSATTYNDINMPVIVRTTGANIPVMTTILGVVQAPVFQINDWIQIDSAEVPHSYKLNSKFDIHVHWITAGTNITDRFVRWQYDYILVNSSVNPPYYTISGTTTLTGETTIPANTPANTSIKTMIITNYTPPVGNLTNGAQILGRLTRVAASSTAPTSDPFGIAVGWHYEQDTIGSRTFTTK